MDACWDVYFFICSYHLSKHPSLCELFWYSSLMMVTETETLTLTLHHIFNYLDYFFCYLHIYIYIYIYIYIWGAYNKFPDFFCMGTFIDSTHEILVPFEVISSGCNALVVPLQQLLEGSTEVLLCEHVNDLHHSLFHLLNCLITTASELRE